MKNIVKLCKERRKKRVRKSLIGTPDRPRLSVHRTLNNFYAQIIDDISEKTLLSASTLEKEFKQLNGRGGNRKAAQILGKLMADRAVKKNIKKVKFDRGGFPYLGRIKVFAESARKNGMEF